MKKILIGVLSGVIVSILFFPSLFRSKKLFEKSTLVGKFPPDFEIEDIKNDVVKKISDISKENIVILNFFASWCRECSEERRKLLQLKSSDENILIVGVVFNDSKDKISEYLKEINPYDFIAYDNGQIALDYGVAGVPETFVIRNQKIVKKFVGPVEIREVLKSIRVQKEKETPPEI